MRAWLADHGTELVLFGLFAGMAGGAWVAFGLAPVVVWLALSAIAAPIIGRAIDSDEAFDIDIDDTQPICTTDDQQDYYQCK
jgi:hypothetical protein